MSTQNRRRARLAPVFFVIFCGLTVRASADDFPVIQRLRASDVVFRQYEDAVREGRRVFTGVGARRVKAQLTAAEWAGRLQIFSYTARADDAVDDTVQSLAARCGVTQASIATVNRLQHADAIGERSLFLPTVSGIFIPASPTADLELLLLAAREVVDAPVVIVDGARYYYFPGDDFSPTERAFFLAGGGFKFPLEKGVLTSRFGQRISPISGKPSFHGGLDIASPLGSAVKASAAGVVDDAGFDAVYGNFVILRHKAGWTSLYGHLSRIIAEKGESVAQGRVIGEVGSTGLSTGAHLHFELRQNGKAANPETLLK